MSDPRLCSPLRLPQPVDNKNGKEGEGGGAVLVKEEAGHHPTDYVLSQGYAQLPPSSSPSLHYTLADQPALQPSVLYMYPGPESPKVHYTEGPTTTSGVSPPSLRLASPVSVIALSTAPEPRLQGDPASSSTATLSAVPTCTFSLCDFGAVSPLVCQDPPLHPSSLPLPVSEVSTRTTTAPAPRAHTTHWCMDTHTRHTTLKTVN